jgi:predicted nucleic acid-binding protein
MLGKSNQYLIVADADAIISFANVEDANHTKAKQIMRHLSHVQANLLYPTTAICEAVTVMRGRLAKPDEAANIIKKFQTGDFSIQDVTQDIFLEAATLYNPQASKKNTLFDAVIAAIAKRLNADAIFSFDEWYKKQGITLAEDFLAEAAQAA